MQRRTRGHAAQKALTVHADGETVTGHMTLKAHAAQSYDIHVTLSTAPSVGADGAVIEAQESSGTFDLKEPYYRQLRSSWWPTE